MIDRVVGRRQDGGVILWMMNGVNRICLPFLIHLACFVAFSSRGTMPHISTTTIHAYGRYLHHVTHTHCGGAGEENQMNSCECVSVTHQRYNRLQHDDSNTSQGRVGLYLIPLHDYACAGEHLRSATTSVRARAQHRAPVTDHAVQILSAHSHTFIQQS